MINLRTFFFTGLLSLSITAQAEVEKSFIEELASEPPSIIARIKFTNFKLGMTKLNEYRRQNNLDVAGMDIKNSTADVVVNETELAQLEKLGFNPNVIMTHSLMRAPDAQYKSPEEIETLLNNFHQSYPELTEIKEVGKSLQGRSIWAIKITGDVNKKMAKPTVLFNAMHHAREVMGPEVGLDIIETLLTNYGKDTKITHWVDDNIIWVMPMFNVDGNNIVWTSNNMWRKNARNNYGVDLNRNYPYGWGSCGGSSRSTYAQDYRGPSAGSEPETQVMMNFVKEIRPVFDISYHSYSELVIYPYGCQGRRTENADVVESIGNEMGRLLGYTPGTSWETLYAVDGSDIDWMYSQYQVIPYVIEVSSSSDGFQPSYTKRDPTVQKNRKGWQLLLDRLDGPGVRGKVTLNGKIVSDFKVKVQIQKNGQFVDYTNYTGNVNGTYQLILNPGVYKLSISGPAITSVQTKDVEIGQTRSTLNLNL